MGLIAVWSYCVYFFLSCKTGLFSINQPVMTIDMDRASAKNLHSSILKGSCVPCELIRQRLPILNLRRARAAAVE